MYAMIVHFTCDYAVNICLVGWLGVLQIHLTIGEQSILSFQVLILVVFSLNILKLYSFVVEFYGHFTKTPPQLKLHHNLVDCT